MIEISNVYFIPEKSLKFALTSIYGIGKATSKNILQELKIDSFKKVKNLNTIEIRKLQIIISLLIVDVDLRRNINLSIKKLIENNSYKGQRFLLKLPVNGQRTRTNAKTRKKIKIKN